MDEVAADLTQSFTLQGRHGSDVGSAARVGLNGSAAWKLGRNSPLGTGLCLRQTPPPPHHTLRC